jgi:hypothetical protein
VTRATCQVSGPPERTVPRPAGRAADGREALAIEPRTATNLCLGTEPARHVAHVPHMCPAAAPKAGTGRDHVEREGTGKVNGLAAMTGNGASCLE